ncbi:MAG: hypothetical protein GWP18_05850 [Proteobacteria bacterium]|nr:hypothetical protein [Pseudomonadota bacterium]
MAIPKSRLLLLIAVPALILLLPLTVYFIDSAAASDKVARNVSIAGIDVARYTEDEAVSAIETYTTGILENTVTVEVNGQAFTLEPAEVELTFDTSGAVDNAMSQYKAGIGEWFTSFSDVIDVPVNSTIKQDLLTDKFLEWELAAIPNPAFEGSIEIVNQNAVVEEPKEGEALDRASAIPLVEAALRSGSSATIVLSTEIATPVHTSEGLTLAADAAEDIVDQGVLLTNDEYGFSFEVDSFTMGAALEIDVPTDGTDNIVFSLDRAVIHSSKAPLPVSRSHQQMPGGRRLSSTTPRNGMRTTRSPRQSVYGSRAKAVFPRMTPSRSCRRFSEHQSIQTRSLPR